MKLLRLQFLWLLRAWPVLSLLPVLACHVSLLNVWPSQAELINRYTSAITQIAGGLLIIVSVDQNLGLFRKKSIRVVLAEWVKSFPRTAKVISLSGHGSMRIGGSGSLSSVATPKAAVTLEEQIAELKLRIEAVAAESNRKNAEVSQRIETVRSEMQKSFSKTQEEVAKLTAHVDEAAVGGFKMQLFGVLLAVYGAFAGIFG